MTYRVRRRIKGRIYLYEQTSYRVGDKVHTRTRYLGVEGAVLANPVPPIDKAVTTTRFAEASANAGVAVEEDLSSPAVATAAGVVTTTLSEPPRLSPTPPAISAQIENLRQSIQTSLVSLERPASPLATVLPVRHSEAATDINRVAESKVGSQATPTIARSQPSAGGTVASAAPRPLVEVALQTRTALKAATASQSAASLPPAQVAVASVAPVVVTTKKRWPPVTRLAELGIELQVDLAKQQISEAALSRRYADFCQRLESLGVARESLPRLRLCQGKQVGWRRSWWSGHYEVTLKARHNSRGEVRRAFFQAYASAALEALATQRPVLSQALEYQFNASYRATQNALNQFILNSAKPEKVIWAIMLKYTGYFPHNRAPQGFVADKLGLVNFKRRRNGHEECVQVLAEIERLGFAKLWRKKEQAHRQNLTYEKRTLSELQKLPWSQYFSVKRMRLKRRLKKAQAQRTASQLFLEKLESLAQVFQYQKPSSSSSVTSKNQTQTDAGGGAASRRPEGKGA